MPVTEMFFNSFLVFGSLFILTTPVITMRLFALEKASGTYETLMTTPSGVIWKWLRPNSHPPVILYLVMWLPTVAGLFIVRHFTNQAERFGRRHHWEECIWAFS